MAAHVERSRKVTAHQFNAFNPDSDFYLDIKKVTMRERIGGGEFSDVYLGSYFGDKARACALRSARGESEHGYE